MFADIVLPAAHQMLERWGFLKSKQNLYGYATLNERLIEPMWDVRQDETEIPWMLAENQIAFVPYASSFRKSSHTVTAMLDADGVLKGECVYDKEKMKANVERTLEHCQDAREHGVLVYSLGDENAVRASCLGPHCMEAYQVYLKDVYRTINTLNQSWGSDF